MSLKPLPNMFIFLFLVPLADLLETQDPETLLYTCVACRYRAAEGKNLALQPLLHLFPRCLSPPIRRQLGSFLDRHPHPEARVECVDLTRVHGFPVAVPAIEMLMHAALTFVRVEIFD